MSEAEPQKAASHQGMLCPVCQVSLVMSERQGIEIDYCPTCRGVWLDRGELDKIIERSEQEQSRGRPARAVPGSAGYRAAGAELYAARVRFTLGWSPTAAGAAKLAALPTATRTWLLRSWPWWARRRPWE